MSQKDNDAHSFDDHEYNRLAAEMTEDSKLQFNLFIFGITATAALLTFIFRDYQAGAQHLLADLPPSILFLMPLIVLLPTSLIILNRARTRNRKAAYIIVSFDGQRLRREGVTNDKPLSEVRKVDSLPWETALHILDRTHMHEKRRPHIAPATLYMMVSYMVLEALCIFLTLYTLYRTNNSLFPVLLLGIFVICGVAYIYRFKLLLGLKDELSIQGYVKRWLIAKLSDGKEEISPTQDERIPLYLREWLKEIDESKSKNHPAGSSSENSKGNSSTTSD